ncbi:eukaryotic phosphomannomutase [Naematelia encephala]|uniref:Phosphomannomutase n=1 Tax=Naematelia encephala TaxID=71784 RepID=A0A1Y2AG34_9TREE|nr:eukaryotic phosphomannomutase [Naematelia encephala]
MATTTPVDVFPAGVKPFVERKYPKAICMFDVDGTLSPARLHASDEMIAALKKLREYTATAFVGGSNYAKIEEQLHVDGENVIDAFDYCFAENGLTAYKLSKQLDSASFIKHVGEEEYKKLVNWILRYLSDVDIPIKRGTFIEFRNGMINVSPIGRNASPAERNEFERYDKIHNIRSTMIEALKKEFDHLKMTFSIGGQISFDVFPTGWDKTFSLRHIEGEGFEEIHFFGDKTYKGGNDYEIYTDPRTIGHSVTNPEDTLRLLHELFFDKA